MKIVIIDNYDSFTYNLSHLLKELGAEIDVVRNDKFELKDLEQYDKIVLSKSGKTKCARFEKRNVQKSGKTKRSKNFAHTTL